MPTRRDFMIGTAAAAAAAWAPSLLAQSTTTAPSERKLGWAFVGLGSLTNSQLAPAILKCRNSRLVAVVTGHPEKVTAANRALQRRGIKDQFGIKDANIYSYETYDKIADNPEIDVVYIVLPNGMHAEYTVRAFKAGKHVFSEKPMANTSAECQQMIDAGKAAGKKLMIAYRCRHEPANLKAIELYRGGQYGKGQLIITDHGFNSAPNVWRLDKKLAGGGALLDIGIYGLNAVRYISGEEPISISAQIVDNHTDPRFAQVEEAITWTMKFPSGLMATCSTSYNIPSIDRLRCIMERGSFDMEPATPYHGASIRVVGGRGGGGPIQVADVDQFQLEMDHFSDCVINNKQPITPGEEGQRDIRIMEAIYESGRTGKTVNLALSTL